MTEVSSILLQSDTHTSRLHLEFKTDSRCINDARWASQNQLNAVSLNGNGFYEAEKKLSSDFLNGETFLGLLANMNTYLGRGSHHFHVFISPGKHFIFNARQKGRLCCVLEFQVVNQVTREGVIISFILLSRLTNVLHNRYGVRTHWVDDEAPF